MLANYWEDVYKRQQLSLFPTEEEQLGEIRKAAAALEQPAAFLISDEVVDDILRTGDVYKRQVLHRWEISRLENTM